MKLRFLLFVLLLPVWVQAQQWPFQLWHDGKIVLLEGDTLKGMIKYDLQQDIVQYNVAEGKKIETYTARKVLFFEIFDTSVHKYRQFFALPFSAIGTYSAPIFFELLEEGKITVLCREALEYRTYGSPYYYGGSYSRQVLVNRFFFMNEKGKIEPFTGGKRALLDLMGAHADDVEKYMKSNHLNYDEKYQLARIVEYYNSFYGS